MTHTITKKETIDLLNVTKSSLYRWIKADQLIPEPDGTFNYDGILKLAEALKNNPNLSKDEYQNIYSGKTSLSSTNSSFSVPTGADSRDRYYNNSKLQEVNENMRQLDAMGSPIKYQNDGGAIIKPNVQAYTNYLRARFGDSLVTDRSTKELWLEKITDSQYLLEPLPSVEELIYDSSANWKIENIVSAATLVKQALQVTAGLVRQVNPYEERLKLLESQWDGKERLDTIFQELLNSPQDPDILKEIARSWFNGAIHNWTRQPYELVYPMMLDINATSQGIGKSFFFNVINGIMLGKDSPEYAGVEGDLNDPANIYPQLINRAVVNDDEHRVYNASQPFGKKGTGVDINATYKNWITLSMLEWTPKHSNDLRQVPVRYVLGRTSNIAKPYDDNDTSEIDRRYLTVRGGTFQQMKARSVPEYMEFMKQVLGEAMHKFSWNDETDANMSPKLRSAMRFEQMQGSKQADGIEYINEILNKPISFDFFSKPIIDVQSYLSGTAEYIGANWEHTIPVIESRFIRPRVIAGALFKLAQAIGTKMTKDQSESLTMTMLESKGFIKYDKHDFTWHNAHYQGDYMINENNDQYQAPNTINREKLVKLHDQIRSLNPINHNKKSLQLNINYTNTLLGQLTEDDITNNPKLVKDVTQALAKATESLA